MILFLLITFTIDVAVRAVKLSFLQLITPVAVIGYIEPGGGIFKTWLKMVVATFVNLLLDCWHSLCWIHNVVTPF